MKNSAFPGTYTVAHYWTSGPQRTCRECGETMPVTLYEELPSGARRTKCVSCQRAGRVRKQRATLTGKTRRELLENLFAKLV